MVKPGRRSDRLPGLLCLAIFCGLCRELLGLTGLLDESDDLPGGVQRVGADGHGAGVADQFGHLPVGVLLVDDPQESGDFFLGLLKLQILNIGKTDSFLL